MANKRIAELVQITSAEVTSDDLLLLADVSALESKKLRLGDITDFILLDAYTGSFYGTSSWAENSATASYVAQQDTASYALTSSWSINATQSISASYALSASNSRTASYALSAYMAPVLATTSSIYSTTASYLLYVTAGLSNGTASHAITSSNSRTASYALTSSRNLGTSSYALTSSHTTGTSSYSYTSSHTTGTSSYSYTSSYAIYSLYAETASVGPDTVLYALSASWASSSLQATQATSSLTSSYLIYQLGANNGTASYAISAGGYPNVRVNYGIHNAITQSAFISQIDRVLIGSAAGGNKSSSFEALGTVVIPFTSSNLFTCSLELIGLDRWSGITSSMDKTPLGVYLPASGAATGSIIVPFSLMGEVPLSGSIMVFVTASQGAIIHPARIVRFDITSFGEGVTVSSAETMSFRAIQSSGALPTLTYTSSLVGGVQSGTDAQIVAVGNDKITHINASNLNLAETRYVWTLSNLKSFNASFNTSLIDVGGMPNSIVTMSLQNSNLKRLAPLTYTSASILDVSTNNLTSLPDMARTMSYINVSSNPNLTRLPDPLPNGLVVLYANNTIIPFPPSVMPNTIVTMSIESNAALSSWLTSFPTSLAYFSCYNTSVTSLPTFPTGALQVNVSNCDLTSPAIDNITSQLVSNGQINGVLNIAGNLAISYSAGTISNLATLSGRGWTVTS